jgi:hypothetical protein
LEKVNQKIIENYLEKKDQYKTLKEKLEMELKAKA